MHPPDPQIEPEPTTLAERYVWDSPGQAVRILMDGPVAERIRTAALGGRAAGVLLGDCAIGPGRTITVRDIEPLVWSLGMKPTERRKFENLVARLKTAGGERWAVGYYRFQTGNDELFLNTGDLVLMKSFFPEPTTCFLLMALRGTDLTSRFFYWQGGMLRPGRTEDGQPFGQPLAAGEDAPAIPAEPKLHLPPMPEIPADPRPARHVAVIPLAALVLLLAAGTLALRYFPALSQLSWRPAPAAAVTPSALSLQVEKRPSDLVLSWNRSAPAILSAQRATLTVRDGGYDRSYDVDLNQLRTGNVFYTPLSGDVQFRLEVYDSTGSPVMASARVLSAAVPPPLLLPDLPPRKPPLPRPAIGEVARPPAPTEDLRPRTIYFSYSPQRPDAGHPKPAPMEEPPAFAVARPTRPVGPGVVPSGVQVVAPAPIQTPSSPPPEPPSVRPAVEAGSNSGPSIPPRVIRQLFPSIPSSIRSLLVNDVLVQVKVSVDTAGKVFEATVTGHRGPLSDYLSEAAIGAARQWRFDPARHGGRPVPSEAIINFRFSR